MTVCGADGTLRDLVSSIRTGRLSARQKGQIIAQMRKMATGDQKARLEQLLAEEYTVYKGTVYDSSFRSETQSHKGETTVSGRTGHAYVGHNTQEYPDGYRVSQDNPGRAGWHWTNQNVNRADPARHEKPTDADLKSVPKTNAPR